MCSSSGRANAPVRGLNSSILWVIYQVLVAQNGYSVVWKRIATENLKIALVMLLHYRDTRIESGQNAKGITSNNTPTRSTHEMCNEVTRERKEPRCSFLQESRHAHDIHPRCRGCAKGRQDDVRCLIQREKGHNAGIHVTCDREANMPELDGQQFARCGISAEQQF